MADNLNLGRIIATQRVWDLIEADEIFKLFVSLCFTRFMMHDWGDLCDEDWAINDRFARKKGGRILASYDFPDDIQVEFEKSLWIILDKDALVTTVLFPGDY